MNERAKELLEKARSLIADPVNHCTKQYSRDQYGMPCDSTSPSARKWCALGALFAAIGAVGVRGSSESARGEAFAQETLYIAAYDLYRSSLTAVNDKHGHGAVCAVYEHAIESLGGTR